MITADQLLCHAIGDYVLQSHWMASEKTKCNLAAAVHALCYGIPFLFIGASQIAIAMIVLTHFLIDRYRLARAVVYAKNFIAPYDQWKDWSECSATGYPSDVPPWLSVWLLIIADNVLHVTINGIALRYL